jgi:predicted metal-dependent hydrolase
LITLDSLLVVLSIHDEDINLFTLRHSHRAKRLIFKPSLRNGFEIILPRFYDDKWVLESIKTSETKIKTRLTQIKEARKELKPTSVTLPSTGNFWKIIYKGIHGKETHAITETSTTLEVPEKVADVLWAPMVLQNWLQKKAFEYLPKRLNDVSTKLNLPYNTLRIKRQKTRWGSCSTKRNINLNRNLMLMPSEVVDYVLHHELVHLKVLNHSSKFWQELERSLPQFQKGLGQLRTQTIPEWALL